MIYRLIINWLPLCSLQMWHDKSKWLIRLVSQMTECDPSWSSGCPDPHLTTAPASLDSGLNMSELTELHWQASTARTGFNPTTLRARGATARLLSWYPTEGGWRWREEEEDGGILIETIISVRVQLGVRWTGHCVWLAPVISKKAD